MSLFDEVIDSYLEREPSLREEDVFHAHELGDCLRLSYYRRRLPIKHPPETLRLFEAGRYAHEFIRRVLGSQAAAERGIRLLEAERPFTLCFDHFDIRCRPDDFILVSLSPRAAGTVGLQETQGREIPMIVEVKSVRGKKVDFITQPSYPHCTQLHVYLRGKRLQYGTILYVARDSFATKPFTVFYDPYLWSATVQRVSLLHECLTKNQLPPPEAKMTREELRKLFPDLPDGYLQGGSTPLRYMCFLCPLWRLCTANVNPSRRREDGEGTRKPRAGDQDFPYPPPGVSTSS